MLESLATYGRPDAREADTDTNDAIDKGLTKAVKDFDSRFPPEWRLSKKGRAAARMTRAARRLRRRRPLERDRRRLLHQAPRRRRRRGHQGGGARGRPAAPLVGLRRRDPRRRRRRAVHVPVVDEAERDRRPGRRRRPRRGCTRCWSGPTRWCGRGDRAWPSAPTLAPDAIRRAGAAPDRHDDHAVRPGGALVRPAATEFTLQAWSGGIVGLGRGVAGPGTGVRRRADRRVAHRRPGRHRHDGLAGRALGDGPGELVDVSMLETLVLCLTYYPVTYVDMVGRPFRSGRSIVTPGRGGDERRPRRARRRHRPAVARLLRDGRAPRVDGGPLALRQPRPPAARRSRRGWRSARRRRSSTLAGAFRIPHAPIGNGATIPATDHFRGARVDRPEPARRLPRARPAVPVRPAAAPRPGAGPDAGRARRRATRREPRPAARRPAAADGAAVRRAARPRPHRVLGRPAVPRTCWRCSAPRCSTSSRRPGPTARACSPACASPSPTGGSGPGSSPASTPTRRASRSTSPASRDGSCCAGCSRPATSSSRTTRRGCWSRSGSTSMPSAPSGPTSSWSGCPASASTDRGATTRPSRS